MRADVQVPVSLGLFAFAARRVKLSTIGILHYIGPTRQFAIGTLILAEPFGMNRLPGLACKWIALAIYVHSLGWLFMLFVALAAIGCRLLKTHE